MARVTIEDCLEQVPTRFGLIHLAAKRVRQIYRGAPVLVKGDNKEIVMALREIAAAQNRAHHPLESPAGTRRRIIPDHHARTCRCRPWGGGAAVRLNPARCPPLTKGDLVCFTVKPAVPPNSPSLAQIGITVYPGRVPAPALPQHRTGPLASGAVSGPQTSRSP